MFISFFIVLLSAISTLANARHIPASTRNSVFTRDMKLCDQFAYTQSRNGYGLNNNLWGRNSSTKGAQCLTYYGESGTGVQWSASWRWEGGRGKVKSFPYSGKLFGPRLVSAITSMPTYYKWSYNNTKIVANVAYDLFTSSDPDAPKSGGDYELMIWLAAYGGARPISATGSPVSSPYLAGRQWDLYEGYNRVMKVYSFVARGGKVQVFEADVKEFWAFLVDEFAYPASSQYLTTFQAGTEPFTGGPAMMTVDEFRAAVN